MGKKKRVLGVSARKASPSVPYTVAVAPSARRGPRVPGTSRARTRAAMLAALEIQVKPNGFTVWTNEGGFRHWVVDASTIKEDGEIRLGRIGDYWQHNAVYDRFLKRVTIVIGAKPKNHIPTIAAREKKRLAALAARKVATKERVPAKQNRAQASLKGSGASRATPKKK